MHNKEYKTFHQALNHAKKSRQETQAMVKCLFPQAFWDHAYESKKEARLAFKAVKRAVNQKRCKRFKRKPLIPHKIEIA